MTTNENCVCKNVTCERYRQCDACREYHYARQGLPACERPVAPATRDA
jgi:hypothetical protein